MSVSDSASERAHTLLGVVQAHAAPEALSWLSRALPVEGAAPPPLSRSLFSGFYVGAGRRFGHARPALTAQEREALREAAVVVPEAYSLSELARAALLLSALAAVPPVEHVELVRETLRRGDNHEQAALLRALALLPEPERFVEFAAEASRSHVQDVFEALAADNPYPCRFFPELNWNQLVMKALFTELPLSRVLGWEGRVGAELARMATDYEAERVAAGRSVPDDVARIKERAVAPRSVSAGDADEAPAPRSSEDSR